MSGTIANNLGRSSGVVGSAGSGITLDSGDPGVGTNPAGGLGTVWSNTTSGETYVCVDITPGSNVWKNVGDGTGSIQSLQFGGDGGGTSYGYRSTGYYPSTDATIDRYSYASDGDAVAVTSMTAAGWAGRGTQSVTDGYTIGGHVGWTATERIEKTTFASTTSQANIGNLMRWTGVGNTSTQSSTHLYTLGSDGTADNGVAKMAFNSEVEQTVVGDSYSFGLGADLAFGSGHASMTHGYRAGGHSAGPSSQQTSKIEKWAFAADGDSVEVANLYRGIDTGISGASSLTHGYLLGGHGSPQTEIDKFPFATDSDSTDVGDLVTGEAYASGTSSLTHGYMAGGGHPQIDVIQKVSFTTDGNATDVGNIGSPKASVSGFHD